MDKKSFKFLLYVIISFITYLAFSYVLKFDHYSVVNLMLIFLLFVFYNSFDFIGNYHKKNIYGIIFCFLLSFSQLVGYVIYLNQYNSTTSFIRELFHKEYLVIFLGFSFFIYNIYSHYFPKLVLFNFKDRNHSISNKRVFFTSLCVMILCWIPYYLVLYPGVLTPDSVDQFSSVVHGFHIVSDHHPVFHTLFVGIFYHIGNFFFNNPVNATAFVSFSQMFIMASIFSYLIMYLNSFKISYKILALVLCYFALSPLHAYYSITMWKDVLFGGLLLLFIIYLIKLDCREFNFKCAVKFIILSLLVMFFRNNAIYMYLFLLPFSFFHYSKIRKKIMFCMMFSIVFFYFVKGPVFKSFNISDTSSSEYIAIPMQQIGRMAYKSVEFNEHEKELINDIIDVSILANVYDPTSCDYIKFSPYYNISAFDQNKFTYFKLWSGLVLKHPSIAVEAYLNSTLGYWYTDVNYWATSNVIMDNDLGIYRSSKINGLISDYVYGITSRDIPIISMQWSIGLCFILILISSFLIFIRRQFSKLYYFVPILGIWITMMLASPVFAEFRYVYGAFTCLPLYLVLPFIRLKEEK